MVYALLLILLTCQWVVTVPCHECPYCCCEDQKACGEITVENSHVFVNSTINITCQVYGNYSTRENDSTLYFTRDINRKPYFLRLNDSIISNETTAILQHTISTDDIHKNFYCETNKEERVVHRIEFFIEYFPQKVQDFECIFKDLLNLQCSWRHPVHYFDPENVKVTFEWRKKDRDFSECPAVRNFTECRNITSNIHGDENYFRINVTNIKKQVTTTTEFSNRFPDTLRNKYGKPSKIDNLRVIQKKKQFIELQWDLESGNSAGQFVLQYNTTDGTKIVTTNNTSVVIQNLTIYTAYKFDVVAHYINLLYPHELVGIPSDKISVVEWTSQDVAKSPPRTTNGGFSTDLMDSSKVRNVTVYWQNFEDMNTNGPVTRYEVTFDIIGGKIENHVINDSDHTQYTLHNIPYNVSGNVFIKAGTQVGMSVAHSQIHIPNSIEAIKSPDILLEIYYENKDNFTMLVSWIRPSNETDINGYTVYWCESTVGCQKQIDWIYVTAHNTSCYIEYLKKNQNYLFGVSMETDYLSSGFSWEKCFYRRDKGQEPAPPNSVRILHREQTSITVTWIRPACDESSPFIKYYILYWCPINQQDKCIQAENSTKKIFTSTSTTYMRPYTIDNLMSGMTYSVWLKAVSTTGIESPPGNKNNNVSTTIPLDMSAHESETLIIVLIVLAVIFIVCIAAVLLYRYNCSGKLYKKYFEKPEIVMPKINVQGRQCLNPSVLSARREESVLKSYVASENEHTAAVGYDNPSLEFSDPQVDNQGNTTRLSQMSDDNLTEQVFLNLQPASDCCPKIGNKSEVQCLHHFTSLDYSRITNECTVALCYNDKQSGDKNLDIRKMDDYTPEVSCSVPLLLGQDAIDTNCSKPAAPILRFMTYSDKNGPNNETSTGLQKGNLEKYCVTHENELHNSTCTSKINNNTKYIHSIQHEMELPNDSSGQFPGTSHYKKPVVANVDIEAYFKEPETTPYLSHNTFQNTELEQVKIETNSSGVGMSLSDYLPAPVIYNNSSSGFSSHDKIESCIDNDSYNDDSLDSSTVECLQFNFNTSKIHQNKRNNAQSSSGSVTRHSMQNGEGLISICPTKNVPQQNINDGYKTIDEINKIIKPVINNIDVTTCQIIEPPTDIIQDQEPEEDST